MVFLLASSFLFVVDDVVLWGVGRRFGGDWGLGIGGCDEEEGTSLVECGEVLIYCSRVDGGRKVRDYGWEVFSCEEEEEERKEEEGLIGKMA